MGKNSDYIFKAFIVNSAEYDNGNKETSGAWLYFPTDAETVKQTFKKIGLPENANPDKYFFDYYACGNDDLKKCFSIYESVDTLNYLAECVFGLDDTEMFVFQTALEVGEYKNVTDVINLTYNTEYYEAVPNIYDYSDLGKYYVSEKNMVLGNAYEYFDFERFGMEKERTEGGTLLNGVYLKDGCTKFTNVYNGNIKEIPPKYLVTEYGRNIHFDIRLQASMELALQIDGYLCEHSTEYVLKYTNPDEPPVYISDCLMKGDTLIIKDMLTATSSLQGDALVDMIYEFEQKYPYDKNIIYPLENAEKQTEQNYNQIDGIINNIQEDKNMNDKIKVLVVEPMQEPYIKEIDASLKSLQKEVDGNIQTVYPFEEEAAIICNEEGKINGLELNRTLYDEDGKIYDILAGTFLVCGLAGDNFGSLPDDLINKFSEHFKQPETFVQVGRDIFAIPTEPRKPSIKEKLQQAKKEQGEQSEPKPPRQTPPEL